MGIILVSIGGTRRPGRARVGYCRIGRRAEAALPRQLRYLNRITPVCVDTDASIKIGSKTNRVLSLRRAGRSRRRVPAGNITEKPAIMINRRHVIGSDGRPVSVANEDRPPPRAALDRRPAT
ncbi:hypothetical protein EVAR_24748_1 [Eumeta japonica]|uniref:Uncharacterized protein n=1 Tax=Eumeta variegata TaxID=151549 RepID=A0A4C1VGB0_EUMVA|nr:hypothetical protein EVAR_24748_1 [Eumeta japonica]